MLYLPVAWPARPKQRNVSLIIVLTDGEILTLRPSVPWHAPGVSISESGRARTHAASFCCWTSGTQLETYTCLGTAGQEWTLSTTTLPAVPTNVTVTAGTGSARLVWMPDRDRTCRVERPLRRAAGGDDTLIPRLDKSALRIG